MHRKANHIIPVFWIQSDEWTKPQKKNLPLRNSYNSIFALLKSYAISPAQYPSGSNPIQRPRCGSTGLSVSIQHDKRKLFVGRSLARAFRQTDKWHLTFLHTLCLHSFEQMGLMTAQVYSCLGVYDWVIMALLIVGMWLLFIGLLMNDDEEEVKYSR